MNRPAFSRAAGAAALVLIVSAGVAADRPRGGEAEAKTESGEGVGPAAVRHEFPLKYVKANAVANAIAELFRMPSAKDQNGRGGFGGFGGGRFEGPQPGATSEARAEAPRIVAVSDDESNLLIISAPEETVREIGEIVRRVDTSIAGIAEMRIFRLQHCDATEAAEVLNGLYADSSASVQSKAVAVGDKRTNSLLVAAAPAAMVEVAEKVGRRDANDAKRQRVFVFQHADPDKAIREMLGGEPVELPLYPRRVWDGDFMTPLEKSRLVVPRSDRVRE